MRKKIFLLISFSIFYSCNEEITNPGEAPYIPQVTNNWIDESDSSHIFSLNSNDDSLSFGIIDGNETIIIDTINNNTDTFDLLGAFHNRKMFITINYSSLSADSSLRYEGSFLSDNRIQMFSSRDTIIISHN